MQAICDSVHAALHGDSQPQWDSTLRNPTGQQAAWSYLSPAKLQQSSLGVPSCLPGRHELRPGDRIFRSRTAGGHGHLHYNISSTTYSTVYSIPADPELDLTGLLDTVPDLAKQAISGGGFLGDIDEIADTYDVGTVVEDLAKQKFLSSALSVPRLSGRPRMTDGWITGGRQDQGVSGRSSTSRSDR